MWVDTLMMHRWCTSEGKGSLGEEKWVGLVHGPQRGLEAHREAKTHTWGKDCWVIRVKEVPHWIKMKRMCG